MQCAMLCGPPHMCVSVQGYMYAAVHKKVYVWKVKENFETITTELETDHGTIYSLAVSSRSLFIGLYASGGGVGRTC